MCTPDRDRTAARREAPAAAVIAYQRPALPSAGNGTAEGLDRTLLEEPERDALPGRPRSRNHHR
ncbi:hypothetical protein [Streptomyces sp. MI02-7b]|uniref:hypothetical protein n=1 Tax=Streptomyces sp. MI02-7b TaxID=462941 RepID=UPI0029A65A10|nr:hypothetical protein [Streptomyces sp. MI02-7b]MDX3071387.1 hypothetical protein [Streptomyces sp. MI02-7b]